MRQPELPESGVYINEADNGTEIIDSSPATSGEDPFPPEAKILIEVGRGHHARPRCQP